jgi:hypothetical protein
VGPAESDARDPDDVCPSIVEVRNRPVMVIDRSQRCEHEGAADRAGLLGDLRSRLGCR